MAVCSRRALVFGGLLGMALVAGACAGVIGVDDATLDPTLAEGGSSGSGILTGDGASACAGKDCACSPTEPCLDPIFGTCANGACRECTTSPDSCPASEYCLPATLECVPGCKSDDDCTADGGVTDAGAAHCDPQRHQCVECIPPDGTCPGTKKCSPSGICAESCSGPAGCDGGLTCCATFCVDPANDAFNCAACGHACTGGAPACCNGTCFDTSTDAKNCGACGIACSAAQATPSCADQACNWACQPNYLHCQATNSGCETKMSVTQCGTCTTDCTKVVLNAQGATCASGACSYSRCNIGFTDADNNKANGCEAQACGDVNEVCCANSKCNGNTTCVSNKCVSCKAKDSLCTRGSDCCSNDCNNFNKCN